LPWEADSRALARDLAATRNQGPISTFAVTELQRRAIPIRGGSRHPIGARPTDFETAQRIIAGIRPVTPACRSAPG
jgi:protein-tyrosine phosphatase